MVTRMRSFVSILAMTALAGCVTLPTGPSVRVMPAPGKSFEQFQVDDAVCRQWAGRQIGMNPGETINQNTAAGAAVGTLVGAGVGAAIGAASGHPGAGAAVGAGSGLLLGTASGANAGEVYGWEAQRRYDIAYEQCMYAKGNQIPGVIIHRARRNIPPPPPGGTYGVPPDYQEPK
jgi:Glycine-zipper domain